MMKNDYRRALILLRSAVSGVSGHVRLERRTLMGSMQFTISGLKTSAPLQAAMAAKTAAGWKIAHIGTLGRDTRGQAGLNWTFDPRSIEGLPLEKYSVLLVLETDGQTCRAVLTGYVNGSVQVDWERVEQAACAGYIEPSASNDAPENMPGEADAAKNTPDTTENMPDTIQKQTSEIENMLDMEERGPDAADMPAQDDFSLSDERLPGTTPVFVETDVCDCPAVDDEEDADVFSRQILYRDELDAPADQESGTETAQASSGSAVFYADPLDVPARAAKTALEALGLDAQSKWPEGIEPLREAFAASEPVFLAAQPEHVFVMAAHSADCPACAVGVRAEKGRPVSVAYAIPGDFSDTPPAGLEGYVWQDGWWVAVADAETGAYLHI